MNRTLLLSMIWPYQRLVLVATVRNVERNCLFCCKRNAIRKASLEVKFLLQPYQVFDRDILYFLNFILICATICDFGNDRQISLIL